MDVEAIAREIVDAGVRLHKRVGPGLLESVYQRLLGAELERRGLQVERNRIVSFTYDGLRFDDGLRIDMLVGGKVVVELKSVEKLVNFGGATLREGLRRIINNYPSRLSVPFASSCDPERRATKRTESHEEA